MRKLIMALGAFIVVAAGAAGYYFTVGQNPLTIPPSALVSSSKASHDPLLALIPSDTPLLSWQQEPIDIAHYLTAFGYGQMNQAEQMNQILGMMQEDLSEPSHLFLTDLAGGIYTALAQPTQFAQTLGLKSQARNASYMVGIAVVLRSEIASPETFWSLFDRAELKSGFKHQSLQSGSVSYRRYPIKAADFTLDLLVAVHEGWAIVVMGPETLDPEHLAIALGAKQPERSLASEGTITQIANQYALNAGLMGFLRLDELAIGLTTPAGNRLAHDIQLLAARLETLKAKLPGIQNPVCQREFGAIAANWPGIFIDAEFHTINAGQIDMTSRILLPIGIDSVRQALANLRGFIPDHLTNGNPSAMFKLGHGMNMAQLATSVMTLQQQLETMRYDCPALSKLSNPIEPEYLQKLLATSVVLGNLRGISVTVNTLEPNENFTELKTLDALVTASATQIESLLTAGKMLYPPLASIELPADGKERSLVELFPTAAMVNDDLRVRMNDRHLMIYSGKEATAQADSVAGQPLGSNGLLVLGINYAKLFAVMGNAMALQGKDLPANFTLFNAMNLLMRVDINAHGLILDSRIKTDVKPGA